MNAPFVLPATAPAALDLNELVARAARVVAPLWPIATFAARSPWQYLEEEAFDQVARQQQRHGIALYPALSLSRAALVRGDIKATDLAAGLEHFHRQHGGGTDPASAQIFLDHAVRGERREIGRNEAEEWDRLGAALARDVRSPTLLSAPRQPLLDATVMRYARLYVGAAESPWPLPGAAQGLFAAWRALAEDDPLLPRTVRAALAACPWTRDAVLEEALAGLDDPSAVQFLEDHLMALPGWAGLLRWQGRQDGDELAPLLDLLALRLALAPALPATATRVVDSADTRTALLALAVQGGFTPDRFRALDAARQADWLALAAACDERACERLLLEALERGYRRDLRQRLAEARATTACAAQAPVAQLVFCIDVRSEPLRRALEASGPFATFGFAGFFGLPVRTRAVAARHSHAACPVILEPRAEIREILPLPEAAARRQADTEAATALESTVRQLKQDPLASLALPELAGLLQGLRMAWQGLLPARWRQALTPARARAETVLSLPAQAGKNGDLPQGLTPAQQVEWTAAALRGIGLWRDFAPLVAIVGHGSRSTNNPYAAKLDCGACGGTSGAFNARLLALLCNQPAVRAGLREQGIVIPDATRFIAAEHITSLDTLEWLAPPPDEGEAGAAWQQLNAALPGVSAALRRERLSQLPAADTRQTAPALAEAWRRASDWSETRPEWGLARNAAFIIGRRALSTRADLGARAFLHSYDWRDDSDGSVLASIVAGPVTVGQWINLQYFASTVSPERHGSGSKATQTVTAGVGVMQGNASDLLPGLPWQAVMANDATPWHLPQRLLVVVEAPATHVEQLLATQPGFARKVRHGWLLLASLDPDTHAWKDWS